MTDARLQTSLELLVGIAAGLLIASTWPLWGGASFFPQIPLFGFLCGVDSSVDSTLVLVIVVGITGTVGRSQLRLMLCRHLPSDHEKDKVVIEAAESWRRRSTRFLAGGFIVAAALNQHRLQPWVWHFLLLLPLLSFKTGNVERDTPSGMSLANRVLLLTASIYIWSGWSKLDATFATSYGQQFVEAMLSAVGLSTRFWPESWKIAAALCLPIGEILCGVLIATRLRRIGLILSLFMHGGLLLAVGPLGLNHERGVLIWNCFFIAQNVILFRYFGSQQVQKEAADGSPVSDELAHQLAEAVTGKKSRSILPNVSTVVLVFAIAFPLLRPFGFCDIWPAWAVYASQPEQVRVLVDQDAVEKLSEKIQQFVEPRKLEDGRAYLRVDLWSLAETNAPIYPGERFAIGIALWLSEQPGLENAISIVRLGEAGRWTQHRTVDEYRGLKELKQLADRFQLNCVARRED